MGTRDELTAAKETAHTLQRQAIDSFLRASQARERERFSPDSGGKMKKKTSSDFLSSLSRVSLLFRDSIADPRNYFCRLPSFDRKARRHRRSRLSTGDDN